MTPSNTQAPEHLGLASLDHLAVQAEAVVSDYRLIDETVTKIGVRLSALEPERAITEIGQGLAVLNTLELNQDSLQMLALRIAEGRRCATREEIGEHIALLLGSFPYGNVPDPDVYTRMMIEEIAAVGPSIMVVDSACRSLRRSLRWLPSIAQALETIALETKRWEERLDCARDVSDHHALAIAKLEQLGRSMQKKIAESREHVLRRLTALESELHRAEREGRGSGHRWPWQIKWDIDRLRGELGGH